MKKFLPLIIFITVFSAVLAGQIGLKLIKDKKEKVVSEKSKYEEIEKKFANTKVKTLDGKDLHFASLKSPAVILNFWASWCRPCLEEMPSMMALKKALPEDALSIVAINTDEEDQKLNIKKTLQKVKHQNEFIIVPDEQSKLVTDYNVTAIPVTLVYVRGKVVHVSMGPMDFNSIEFKEKIKAFIQ